MAISVGERSLWREKARDIATCLVPALPTAVVVALFVWFMANFGIQRPLQFDLSELARPEGFHAQSEAATSLIAWAVTGAIFVIAWMAVAGGALRLISTPVDRGAERWRWVVAAGAAVLTTPILANQERALTISGLIPILQASFQALDLEYGKRFLALFPALAFAGAALVLVAACTTLAPATGAEGEAEHLRRQVARLRSVLYLGAALLVAGTVQNAAMHEIPVALTNGPQAQDLSKLARTVCAATGTFWTLLLIAVYVPCAVVLRSRATELASRENPSSSPADRDGWLAKRDLNVSFGQGLRSVVAMLSPLLAGLPTSALLQALTGPQ